MKYVMSDGSIRDCHDEYSMEIIHVPDGVVKVEKSYATPEEAGAKKIVRKIIFPPSVTTIGELALENCSLLENIVLSPGLEKICYEAFYGCRSLNDFELPDSVREVDCGALINTSLNDLAEEDKWSPLVIYCGILMRVNSESEHIVVPDGVRSIGGSAFWENFDVRNVELPDSVTEIGDYAFYNCENLETIRMSKNVMKFGNSVFYNCRSLETVDLPNGVKKIGASMFDGCRSLKKIHIPDSVERIGELAFYDCKNLEEIDIPDSVKSMSDFVFNKCSNLKKINMPKHVEKIGNSFFCGCRMLTEIDLPDTLTIINDGAFYGCKNLENIHIPENVRLIDKCAFYNCRRLVNVTIPDGVETIGKSAFEDCSNLVSVRIPDSVTELGDSAFKGCSSLTEIRLPETIRRIGDDAFRNCTSLQSIVVPPDVEFIGGSAFENCGLVTATIPAGAQFGDGPESGLFKDCRNLTSVTLSGEIIPVPVEERDVNAAKPQGAFAGINRRKAFDGTALKKIFAPGVPLSEFPKKWKDFAISGFVDLYAKHYAFHENVKADYVRTIKRSRKRYYPVVVKDSDLLQFMIAEKIILPNDISFVTKLLSRPGCEELMNLVDHYEKGLAGSSN